jgi:hypothetical protein
MHAGKDAIGHNVPEYEVALATSQAGTRKAAEILENEFTESDISPLIHFLANYGFWKRSYPKLIIDLQQN